MTAVLAATAGREHPAELVEKLLALATAFDDTRALAPLLSAVAQPAMESTPRGKVVALAGLLIDARPPQFELAEISCDKSEDDLKAGLDPLTPMFAWARATVKDDKAPAKRGTAALGLLGRGIDGQQAWTST